MISAAKYPDTTSHGRHRGKVQADLQLETVLPSDTPVLTVPKGLLRILNRDPRAAGISKRDDRGRTIDVHAMRTNFGTLLSVKGVFVPPVALNLKAIHQPFKPLCY